LESLENIGKNKKEGEKNNIILVVNTKKMISVLKGYQKINHNKLVLVGVFGCCTISYLIHKYWMKSRHLLHGDFLLFVNIAISHMF